jgi:mRNA interferase HicA
MKSSELLKILKRDGWFEVRQTGSHLIMRHHFKKNQIVVPFHASKEVKKGTVNSILKDAELKTNKR